jgi:2C-methyl-D-erythritol 2,4-cyclodiphosphate synthase
MTRVGLGFDLHPLAAGRPLVLGGVTIEADRGLAGHSDADVLSHAIGEAMLGALALGDLGRHFPDTDARYRNISSLTLLRHVVALLAERGGRLAETLGLAIDRVSVKAKSPEGLGLLGRQEGMAAMAVVNVEVTE